MEIISSEKLFYLLQAYMLFFSCFDLQVCTSIDTITSSQPIKDHETIISNGGAFTLGFFNPINTTNHYVGIWYNMVSVSNIVWVANRDKPLINASSGGTLTISEYGNLVVLDGQNLVIWSSNVSNSAVNSSAQLMDTGNLVLRESSSGRTIWESFEHPSDSFLLRMRIGSDMNTGEKIQLKSWKSPSDPSIGSFSSGLDPNRSIPEIFIWKDGYPYWRSGPWNNQIFTGIPNMDSVYLNGFNLVDNKEGMVYLTYIYANDSRVTYFLLNSEGNLVQRYWLDGIENWEVNWSNKLSECDVYGKCGPFGSCDSKILPICSCLRGFEPKNSEEWYGGNWTSGCVRKTPLMECVRNETGNERGKEDGFLQLTTMKLPDFAEWSFADEDGCKNECLKDCSCVAYAYYLGIGCMLWRGNLIDIQKFSSTGADLYIRVAYTEIGKKRNAITIIATTVTLGSFAISIFTYLVWRWMTRRKGTKKESELLLSNMSEHVKFEELPLFTIEKLAIATENFNSGNKLGQGGFGAVYKGTLPDGQEIAVKRLSRASEQGLEEFMNEVVVISKLQHRNLVRLLGCCAEGEEKMLIYENMSNKSLDAFLFDPMKRELLDWRKRLSIIEGIGRGLLYLHRDSRLRIIHRDLKASNILLDGDLNPKISDFGIASIFGGNQDQANTKRVVGTYGYMAPEYAMEGRFSEKSDVFSFGVLLLEIVSGRRNTSFYNDEHSLSLLGFAWKLWKEDEIIEFIDTAIYEQCYQVEILRCIHVGLLCVQEFAKDRPSISTVLWMLSSEFANLPSPKQPAFTERQISSDKHSSQDRCSANNVTVTIVSAR